MNKQSLALTCTAQPELSGLLKPCLEQACTSLDLAMDFVHIALVVDDHQGGNEPWLHFDSHPGPGSRPGLEMYLNPELFGKLSNNDSGIFPRSEIWESREAPRQDVAFDGGQFRPEFCLQYLHHHLLTARDIARRELILGRIPPQSAEAYQACWAVTVDGRLEKWALPGFVMPERRRHFSRLFSLAGVLMPSHWSIFQALWEGDISGQAAVLEAVGGLPRL